MFLEIYLSAELISDPDPKTYLEHIFVSWVSTNQLINQMSIQLKNSPAFAIPVLFHFTAVCLADFTRKMSKALFRWDWFLSVDGIIKFYHRMSVIHMG